MATPVGRAQRPSTDALDNTLFLGAGASPMTSDSDDDEVPHSGVAVHCWHCNAQPSDATEMAAYKDRVCLGCTAMFCENHYNVYQRCSNVECVRSELCSCDECVERQCVACEMALCDECWRDTPHLCANCAAALGDV